MSYIDAFDADLARMIESVSTPEIVRLASERVLERYRNDIRAAERAEKIPPQGREWQRFATALFLFCHFVKVVPV